MLEESSREALREALVGTRSPRTEALILMSALPDEDLPKVIRIMRRMIGFDEADRH